jgi:hypothetical protein
MLFWLGILVEILPMTFVGAAIGVGDFGLTVATEPSGDRIFIVFVWCVLGCLFGMLND